MTALALTLTALAWPTAAAAFERCPGRTGVMCGTVSVPLDRAGRVAGSVPLHVERVPSGRRTDRALMILGGGPGESITDNTQGFAGAFDFALDERDLVVFDSRGTGRSGLLRCPRLERITTAAGEPEAAEECARRLGPRRAFYTTRDSVADIEAVREAVGAERLTLYGVSYGTKIAVAYAARHPDRVERLVLDGVVPPEGLDPLYRDAMAAAPRVLREVCLGGCRGITRDPGTDLAALMRRFSGRELRGPLVGADGRVRAATLGRFELLSLLLDGDFEPALRAPVPAAIRSASRRDLAPILRLRHLAVLRASASPPPDDFSSAVYATTLCEETPLPWQRDAPIGERPSQAAERLSTLPESMFRPFDRATALESDLLRLCRRWPAASEPPEPAAQLPDVPVLVLAGREDLRTPVEGGLRLARRFRRATLVEVPAAGHGVFSGDGSPCASRAVERFLAGRPFSARCGPPRGRRRPERSAPLSLADVRPVGATDRPGRTLGAVLLTLRDVDRVLEVLVDTPAFSVAEVIRFGGLRAGRFVQSGGFLELRGVSYVPGVRITGRLRDGLFRTGRLRVSGPAAAPGTLTLSANGRVRGRLGGRPVEGRTPLGG